MRRVKHILTYLRYLRTYRCLVGFALRSGGAFTFSPTVEFPPSPAPQFPIIGWFLFGLFLRGSPPPYCYPTACLQRFIAFSPSYGIVVGLFVLRSSLRWDDVAVILTLWFVGLVVVRCCTP